MAAQWQALGEVNYSKWAVYDMQWNVTGSEIEHGILAGAPCSGPVAIFTASAGSDQGAKIYSLSGKVLGTANADAERIVQGGFGWLRNEILLLVLEDGEVERFTCLGRKLRGEQMSFRSILREDGLQRILRAEIFSVGVAVVLENGKVAMSFADEKRVKVLNSNKPVVQVAEQEVVTCIAVSMSDNGTLLTSEERWASLNVIVATSHGRVVVVTEFDCSNVTVGAAQNAREFQGTILRLQVSPSGKYIACFSETGWLTVMNMTFTKALLEFDTKSGAPPMQICWSGDDCVVCSWKQLGLLLIGPYGDWVKYTYLDPVFIVQDIDSLRVLTSTRMEILQRVHPSTESILKIGSFAPSAMLCDAVEAVESGDSKADITLQAIKDEGHLVDAVKGCIQSACTEFDVSRQQELMKAASVGKAFCDFDEERRELASDFVLGCNALRVLNVVRHESVGLPLTIQQYESIGPRGVISRLASRNMFLLALKICSYLSLPPTVKQLLLTEWAEAKIRAEMKQLPIPLTRRERTNSFSSVASTQSVVSTASSYVNRSKLYPGRYASPVKSVSSTFSPGSPGRGHAGNNVKSLVLDQQGAQPQQQQQQQQSIRIVEVVEDQEQNLFTSIQTKLTVVRGIRYTSLARLAQRSSKPKLASLLAHCEPVSFNRIMQLLHFSEYSKALAYAVHSHDPCLILFSLLSAWPAHESPLRKTRSLEHLPNREVMIAQREKFIATVSQFPIARNIFAQYCESNGDFTILRDVFQHSKKIHAAASLSVREGYLADSIEKRLEKMSVAVERFKEAGTMSSFYQEVTSDQMKLLRIQRELEELTGKACFVDNSLSDTIFNCLILQLDKKASQLRDEFRLPSTIFTNIKIKALAQRKDWEKLKQLSNEKRIPVSLLSFVEACLDAENVDEARQYAMSIKDDKERLEAFIKAKMWENAVHAAVQVKDITTLQLIRNRIDDEDLRMDIMRQVRVVQEEGG